MLKNTDYSQNVSIGVLSEKVSERLAALGSENDGKIMQICRETVCDASECAELSLTEKARLARLVYCTLRCELEILQDEADDPAVTEIMVNGCRDIFIERNGKIERSQNVFENPERLEQVIQRLAARVGREINDLNPILDARLSDGSRINAVHRSLALNGPVLTIRKFSKDRLTAESLIKAGDISKKAAEFLEILVRSRYNIFISGGTSSGKTTFLNILSDYIPASERIVVIEDSAELQIRGHENLVRLEARSSNVQGKGAVTIRDLIKSSLRMRPDRIIVGEVRGGEVVDMLAAMSTGHDGSLSTGHANSAAGMLGRLETMALSGSEFPYNVVRSQICEAIDIFVHLARLKDGHRRVIEISELAGLENGEFRLNRLFSYDPVKGLYPTGSRLIATDKLLLAEGDDSVDRLQDLLS